MNSKITSKDYQEALAMLSLSLLDCYPITPDRIKYKTSSLSTEQVEFIATVANKAIYKNKLKMQNCFLL